MLVTLVGVAVWFLFRKGSNQKEAPIKNWTVGNTNTGGGPASRAGSYREVAPLPTVQKSSEVASILSAVSGLPTFLQKGFEAIKSVGASKTPWPSTPTLPTRDFSIGDEISDVDVYTDYRQEASSDFSGAEDYYFSDPWDYDAFEAYA